MPRARAAFSAADITRAVRGAKAGGMDVVLIEISPEKIVLSASATSRPEKPANDVDKWLTEHPDAG